MVSDNPNPVSIESTVSEAAELAREPLFLFELENESCLTLRPVWANTAFRRLIDCKDIALPNVALDSLIENKDLKQVVLDLASCPDDTREMTVQVRLAVGKAIAKQCEMTVQRLQGSSSDADCWVASFQFSAKTAELVSELASAQAEAALLSQRLWDAIEALPDAFVMYDSDNRLVACNQRYKDFYELSAPAIYPGARFEDIMRFGVENGQYPEATGQEEAWLAEIIGKFRGSDEPINRILSDGRHIVIHDVTTDHDDVVGLRTDVTILRHQEQLLQTQAKDLEIAKLEAEAASKTDSLTGLGNRRGLDEFIASIEDRVEQSAFVGVLHFDLDKFKEINDGFGHAAGDSVLCCLADILQRAIGCDGYAARIGGDEFLVLIWAQDIQAKTEQLAAFVIDECSKPSLGDGLDLPFSVSVGIATGQSNAIPLLWSNADIALYESKRGGRGMFTLFSPAIATMEKESRELRDAITRAVAEDEIDAYFQPQLAAESGLVVGMEALARWCHSSLGQVPPSVFLPVADELGLNTQIDEAILRKALACTEALSSIGANMPSVSINVSEESLFSDQFHNAVGRMKTQTCPVIFELLETIDFEANYEDLKWATAMLRRSGARIALDDFGSGRSSLTALMDLRPDRIKIDRRIVGAIDGSASSNSHFMAAICEMAKAVDIRLTAEGVETVVQAKVATELGCDTLQGFLFAKPLSEADIKRFLLDAAMAAEPDYLTSAVL